jgi:hypothetical protein
MSEQAPPQWVSDMLLGLLTAHGNLIQKLVLIATKHGVSKEVILDELRRLDETNQDTIEPPRVSKLFANQMQMIYEVASKRL